MLAAWWPITDHTQPTQHLINTAHDDLADMAHRLKVQIAGEPHLTRTQGARIDGAAAYDEVIYCEVEAAPAPPDLMDRQADLVEDVEWMLSWRTHPQEIAHRLGVTPGALERRLIRYGRRDLAQKIRAGGRSCADCGGQCAVKAARCRKCAGAARYGSAA